MSTRIAAVFIAVSLFGCNRARPRTAPVRPVPATTAAAPVAEAACSKVDLAACARDCMQRNDVDACMTLGRTSLASENRGIAYEAMFHACELGNACGCTVAGAAMVNGAGTKKSPAKGALLLRKACEGGCESGCTSLGFLYEQGNGVDKDIAMAAAYYARGCELGSARGCGYLGVAYVYGDGVRKDEEQGLALLRRACEDDDAWSCNAIATLKKKPDATPATNL